MCTQIDSLQLFDLFFLWEILNFQSSGWKNLSSCLVLDYLFFYSILFLSFSVLHRKKSQEFTNSKESDAVVQVEPLTNLRVFNPLTGNPCGLPNLRAQALELFSPELGLHFWMVALLLCQQTVTFLGFILSYWKLHEHIGIHKPQTPFNFSIVSEKDAEGKTEAQKQILPSDAELLAYYYIFYLYECFPSNKVQPLCSSGQLGMYSGPAMWT